MTLEELLAEGQQKLDEINRRHAADEAAAATESERLRREFWLDFMTGLAALLPAEVWPYVSYPTDHIVDWSYEVTIAAPACAPIMCDYRPRDNKFDSEAFRVPDVENGYYTYDGEGIGPQYVHSNKRTFFTSDIALALAVARQRHIEFTQATAAYEQRKAEVDQMLAERAAASQLVAAPTTAAPELAPSVGDQLVALIRAVAREELAANRQEW